MLRVGLIMFLLGIGPGGVASAAEPPPRGANLTPPPPPGDQPTDPARNPVSYFRHSLTLDSNALQSALAGKSETQRRYLEIKVREYASLPAEERAARLRVLELYSHLTPLLKTNFGDTAARLEQIPPADRIIIENRLAQWNLLPPALRDQLLGNETSLQNFLRLGDAVAAESNPGPGAISPTVPAPLEAEITRWQALSREKQLRLYRNFLHFFDLSPAERQKALHTLPASERGEMTRSLAALDQLAAADRLSCLESLRKFANLSAPERQSFLESAGRWRSMTPEQRRVWREVVGQLPPSPPGLDALRSPHAPGETPSAPGINPSANLVPPR